MLKLHPSVISRRDGKCNVMFTLRNGIQYKKGVRERERERNRLGWGGGCLMDKHDAREFFFFFKCGILWFIETCTEIRGDKITVLKGTLKERPQLRN